MSAANWDVSIEQGVAYLRELTYKDSAGDAVPITGWKFSWGFKRYQQDTEYHAFFDTGSNGGLVVSSGIEGKLNFVLPADATYLITLGRGIHELRAEPSTDPHTWIRLAYGVFTNKKAVIHADN